MSIWLVEMQGKQILLIGSGNMAIEYAKVLKEMKKNFIVIGRGENSAGNFFNKTGIEVVKGGLQNWILDKYDLSSYVAIVACSVIQSKECTIKLLEKGCKEILLEKPGGIVLNELYEIESKRSQTNGKIYVAYNRRFYASVLEAKRLIELEGGVLSFVFEFTEWSHKIAPLKIPKEAKENWFYGNSTHVIDLAFFLGGKPTELTSYKSGGLEWHPEGSVFTGAGKTNSNALFSYHSNWESAGRWKVEVLTKKHRFLFSPLEKLQIQEIGTIVFNEVDLDYDLDIKFKPGLYLQVQSFLEQKNQELFLTLQDQITHWSQIYQKILKGT